MNDSSSRFDIIIFFVLCFIFVSPKTREVRVFFEERKTQTSSAPYGSIRISTRMQSAARGRFFAAQLIESQWAPEAREDTRKKSLPEGESARWLSASNFTKASSFCYTFCVYFYWNASERVYESEVFFSLSSTTFRNFFFFHFFVFTFEKKIQCR